MRTGCLTILLIFSIMSALSKSNEIEPDSLITEVNYEYKIESGDNGNSFCLGTLFISINVPDSTEQVVFYRANGPTTTELHRYPPFYNHIRPIDILGKSKIKVKAEAVEGNTYFRVSFRVNGSNYYSSHFAINDWISPEDIEKLNGTDAISDIKEEIPIIELLSKQISIKCNSPYFVDILSMEGKTIFNKEFSCNSTISLASGIYIISLRHNGKKYTKKIVIL